MSAQLHERIEPARPTRGQTGPAESPLGAATLSGAAGGAREDRERAMRIAEYTPFPRFSRHQSKRLGFTSEASAPLLHVTVRDAEKPGTLLRVVVRGIDGRPQLDALARVAWCNEKKSGHLSMGLAVVDADHPRARLVRHTLEDNEPAIRA